MILRDKDRHTLLAIFSTSEIPMEVWAYGSRVSGEAHEGSDLDLVIRTPNLQSLPIEAFLKLKEKIRDSNIPIKVDLFDWARLPQSFHRNIEAQYEVLYSNLISGMNEPSEDYAFKKESSDIEETTSKEILDQENNKEFF
jgi:predicted nucleotidyltransferase